MWDTLSTEYYAPASETQIIKNADVHVICFDITSRHSFKAVRSIY